MLPGIRIDDPTSTPAGIEARVTAGDILHLWQKPVTATAQSCVQLREASGETSALVGPRSGDFQMIAHRVAATGEISLSWNALETTVSLCYAYDPDRALSEGIRILWVRPEAAADSKRYRLHLAPPFGWMNDPNGLVSVDGRTHAFYQHYPHAWRWGPMHWGHAVSDDLVNWTHLPVFLHPGPAILADPMPKGGAFSGSAIVRPQGGIRVFHTDREDGRAPEHELQMTAVSTDLLDAGPSAVVIGERPPLDGFGNDLRDPYVFMGPDGLWKMVLGGNDAGAALVLLYESDDPDAAANWRFVGVLHREPLARSVPAECPSLVPLVGDGGGLYALVFGLIGHQILIEGKLNPSVALVGRFDGRHFEAIARRELDFVGDCYAFQAFVRDGRPQGMAWAVNWANVRRNRDFSSAMTFVRRLLWRDGALLMPPVEGVALLRTESLSDSAAALRLGVELPDGLAEISFDVAGAPFRLTLAHEDFPMTLVHDGRTLELEAERTKRAAPYVAETGPLANVRVFVDVGMVEIYADGGHWCGTKRIDSDEPVAMVRLEADLGTITNVEVWRLRPQSGAHR